MLYSFLSLLTLCHLYFACNATQYYSISCLNIMCWFLFFLILSVTIEVSHENSWLVPQQPWYEIGQTSVRKGKKDDVLLFANVEAIQHFKSLTIGVIPEKGASSRINVGKRLKWGKFMVLSIMVLYLPCSRFRRHASRAPIYFHVWLKWAVTN